MIMSVVRLGSLVAALVIPSSVATEWSMSPMGQVPGLLDALQVAAIWLVLRFVRDSCLSAEPWAWWRLTRSALTSGAGAALCLLAVGANVHYANVWGDPHKPISAVIALALLGALLAVSCACLMASATLRATRRPRA